MGELGSSNAAFFFPLPAGGNIGDACPPALKLPLCRSRRLREVYSMEDEDVDEAAAGPWPASTPGRAGLKRDLEGSFMREEDEEEEREVKQMKRSAAAAVVAPPRGGRSPSVAIGPCKVRRKGLGLVVKWVRTKE